MTNEKMWIIDRMKRCASFYAELSDVDMHINNDVGQRDAVKEVYRALGKLVRADSAVIAKGGR